MSDDASDFLEHFGVKGMHWGVRKAQVTAPVNTTAETVNVVKETSKKPIGYSLTKAGQYEKKNVDTAVTVVHQPGKKLATKGGSNRPAHEDAVKAAAAKRVAQSSTTDALSNSELKALVNRMNLEKQYRDLAFPVNNNNKGIIKKGTDKVNEILNAKGSFDRAINDPAMKTVKANFLTEYAKIKNG